MLVKASLSFRKLLCLLVRISLRQNRDKRKYVSTLDTVILQCYLLCLMSVGQSVLTSLIAAKNACQQPKSSYRVKDSFCWKFTIQCGARTSVSLWNVFIIPSVSKLCLLISLFTSCRKQFFQEAGEVVDIRFSTFEDGNFRGFGHVEFATAEAAKKVNILINIFWWLIQYIIYWFHGHEESSLLPPSLANQTY